MLWGQTSKAPITAGEVVDRILKNIGIPPIEQTVDNIIAGDRSTPVRGIATTMMATLDVMQRAAAAGKNMVITHESTFYSHQDTITELKDKRAYVFKTGFIAKNQIVSFHLHDHWHRRKPDGIAVGMAKELAWEKYMDPENPRLFALPKRTLAQVATEMQTRLKAATVRVVGDPGLPVSRAIASWGYAGEIPVIRMLDRTDVDVVIVGETREWEAVEYAQDLISSGEKKALIVLGHVASEQAGMKYCAEWMKGFITEVPIEFIPASEPFWNPTAG